MSAKVKFIVDTKAFKDLAEQLVNAGADLEAACSEVVEMQADVVYKELSTWADKHYYNGDLKDALTCVIQKNTTSGFYKARVEFDANKNEKGFEHAIFLEFGKPKQKPDPCIRNVSDKVKKDINKLTREIMKKFIKKANGG